MRLDPYTRDVAYAGWKAGLDNRTPDAAVADDALRVAQNVDVLTSGKLRSRDGIVQQIAAAGSHSVFATANYMVWATASALYRCDASLLPVQLLSDARLALALSYVEVNGEIYFSNEQIHGKITASGAYAPWGITPPASAPVCSGSPLGSGLPRTYQVTCTFVTASGEESGAPLGVAVVCGDTPSITLSSIPQSADARVVATRIYVTNINGTEFFSYTDVPAGQTTAALSGFFGNGMPLRTQFQSPPPPGQLLEYLDGVIYIASGSTIWHTEPLYYGLHDNVANFFMHSERVTLLKAVPDGLYVSADATYFMPKAGTKDVVRRKVLPYRAVEGAAANLPDSVDVLWFSERGFVRGSLGGAVKNLTEDRVFVPRYTSGRLHIDVRNGHQAAVALVGEEDVAASESSDYTSVADLVLSEGL